MIVDLLVYETMWAARNAEGWYTTEGWRADYGPNDGRPVLVLRLDERLVDLQNNRVSLPVAGDLARVGEEWRLIPSLHNLTYRIILRPALGWDVTFRCDGAIEVVRFAMCSVVYPGTRGAFVTVERGGRIVVHYNAVNAQTRLVESGAFVICSDGVRRLE